MFREIFGFPSIGKKCSNKSYSVGSELNNNYVKLFAIFWMFCPFSRLIM